MGIKFRYQIYDRLKKNLPKIIHDAKMAADEIGIPMGRRGSIQTTTVFSSSPGPLMKRVLKAIDAASRRPVYPVREAAESLRGLVKDFYGDDYDVASTCTCEAALRVTFETLFAPPAMRKGDAARARFIGPYEHDIEYMANYGRLWPPKYKNLLIDRSTSSGELGVEGKSLPNLDCVLVPIAGASYPSHGVNYSPVPFLVEVDATETAERLRHVAERHAFMLSGFESLGYDTVGYGYGEMNDEGVPKLKKLIAQLAGDFDVPYVIDSAASYPIVGYDIRKVGNDVILWSMDKIAHGLTSGLIIGKEDVMNPIRRALGLGGERGQTVSSYGKGSHSFADPGREAIISQIEVLKYLIEEGDKIKRQIDRYHEIVREEFSRLHPSRFWDDLIISKSYHMGQVEVNYERTWGHGEMGMPIFSDEDTYCNTDLLGTAISEMGVVPPLAYSGNIEFSLGPGLKDESGIIVEENARFGVKAVVKALEILNKHAGIS